MPRFKWTQGSLGVLAENVGLICGGSQVAHTLDLDLARATSTFFLLTEHGKYLPTEDGSHRCVVFWQPCTVLSQGSLLPILKFRVEVQAEQWASCT